MVVLNPATVTTPGYNAKAVVAALDLPDVPLPLLVAMGGHRSTVQIRRKENLNHILTLADFSILFPDPQVNGSVGPVSGSPGLANTPQGSTERFKES